MKKTKKPINNLYFYFMIVSLFIAITFLVVCFTNNTFYDIRGFWGFWLIWTLFLAIFIIMLILFILNIVKYKNNQKLLQQKNFNRQQNKKKEF